MQSSGEGGRRLEALGWNTFRRTRKLGHIDLHVDRRKPLLIARYEFEDHTLKSETDEVLGRLLVCAESVALELLAKLQMDHGYVDWQVPERNVEAICRLYGRYKPPGHSREDLERGSRCLRYAPPATTTS